MFKIESVTRNDDEDLKKELHRFWDHETLGIKEKSSDLQTDNGPLEGKINFINDRYQVSLPFKVDHPTIPDNYQVAKHILNSLLNRLNKTPKPFFIFILFHGAPAVTDLQIY